jgi:hypothetical protein
VSSLKFAPTWPQSFLKTTTLSEVAKEIKFIVQVWETIGIKVKLPIIVRVDNVGAIFMSEHVSTSRHIDICYHYVREYVEK